GACASVVVLEADDVVELWGRDLDDQRILDRPRPVHCPRSEAKGRALTDDLPVDDGLPDVAELDLEPALEYVPRLVLLPVELPAERSFGLHEQELSRVVVG